MDLIFSLVGSRRTQHISSIGLFYKNKARGDGGLSDCEELVGLLTGDDGVGFLGIKYSSKVGLLSKFNHQYKLFFGHLTETQESKSFF